MPITADQLADDVVAVRQKSVTLTDDDIKALYSVPFEIVPAQGVGTIALPLAVVLDFDLTTGYTVQSDASPQLYHPNGPGVGLSPIMAISVNFTGRRRWYGAGVESNLNVGGNFDGYILSTLQLVENDPIVMADHWAGGDYAGGNAANTLKVTVLYSVINV